jgi:hypothetical protein
MTDLWPTSYLIGKTETISFKYSNETRMPILPIPIQYILGIPCQCNKARRKKIKVIQIGKEIVKVSLFLQMT